MAPEYPNPWVSDNPELWEQEKQAKDISARRVKRWAFGLQELLQDPIGHEHFVRFLDKEFSGENLKSVLLQSQKLYLKVILIS